jgi:uncharacterized membrane protein
MLPPSQGARGMHEDFTLSIGSYYEEAAIRAFWNAFDWVLGQGILLTLLIVGGTIVFELLVVAMQWKASVI